ncbi:hypothetical protein ACFHYQ_08010 [Sphaerimonospora cavernae]|uniref:Uncharacterized protein n=1 Tax=Sphaerimonospora cavernae TaxID=1740611 RepID=A0ABV6U1B3_9ACTN
MSLPVAVLPVRQSYSLFWWWSAALLIVWEFVLKWLALLVPSVLASETVTCGWTSYVAEPAWKEELSARLWQIDVFVSPAVPVTMVLCIWVIARRGAGHPHVHKWTAFAGVSLVCLDYALKRALALLNQMPEEATCSVDPATFNAFPLEYVGWTFASVVFIMLGAWAGMRSPNRPGRRRPLPWRPIALVAVVAALLVAVGVVIVRLTPKPPPAVAADGTPRHALVLTGHRLAVLDLVEGGGEPDRVDAPDDRFYQFTAVVRDTAPGRYLAAVSTAGNGAWGDRSSRIYRIAVHGDGGAEIGERVGGDYEGIIKDLAVSPQGRIAYSRAVGKRDEFLEIDRTFVGLVDDHREWSAAGGQGLGTFGDGGLGLHWRDPDTLVFRAIPPKADSARLVALDTRRPGADLSAARTLLTMGVLADGTALTVPGETRMVMSQVGVERIWDQQLVVVDPAEKKPIGLAFAPGCGNIAAFTLDRSGRHLLVSVDNKAGHFVGDPPEPACGNAPPYQLFRVDLRPTAGTPGPTPRAASYPGEITPLELPQTPVWSGKSSVHGIAW